MSQSSKTLFIVDDESLLTQMLQDYLMEHFPEVVVECFATGEQCLKKIGTNPDFVILDYHLNSKELEAANGIDILKEIKQRSPSLPVIMLSSQTNYGIAGQTVAYGAIHYVTKGEQAFDEIRKLVQANL